MLDNLFTTDRFYLRPLVESDATNKYLSWLNNNKITFFLNSHYKKNSIESIVNYINKHNSIDSFHIGIFTKDSDIHIGNYSIYLDLYHLVASTNVMIGDTNFWEKKVVLETRAKIIDILFCEYNMHKIIGTPFATNYAAIYNYLAQGFVKEGVLKGHKISPSGERVDIVQFALFRK